MKSLANVLAQFAAIVMIMVVVAVTSAALSQWASGGVDNTSPGDSSSQAALLAVSR
jgi:hypothetical protein